MPSMYEEKTHVYSINLIAITVDLEVNKLFLIHQLMHKWIVLKTILNLH
jgi:hypothetical protein